MLALGLIAAVPVLMWLSQTVLLWRAGLPFRWRISTDDLPRAQRGLNRALTNAAFAAVLLAYPLLRGQSPLAYYAGFVPLASARHDGLFGAAAATLYLVLLYLAWMLSGNVEFSVRHRASRLVQRLAGVPLTAVLAAGVEELLFRAMLLAGLLESFPPAVALPIGIVVFAGAHYVRRVKRYWTFGGHLALGTLFCLAFWCTGTLWLSLGLHAGGILVLMGARPFVRYTGPPWLVGASIFPYAGVFGILGLLLLTLNVWLSFGGV
ncbi:MAG: CPBP family intramembrane metalloprotease [Phycisphaerae bacterium]|nr:CPBP family intramembrane metalloprotease [Phycisphaerae bacterium]